MSDFLFQTQTNNVVNDLAKEDLLSDTAGSPENHCPYVPKYSMKDESLLRRVDLTSLESINSAFFPEEHQKGKIHWIVVPKHILGIDTDFSFVAKKLDEYRQLERLERQRELSRWDKMQRWERNMYEDRIAILMQQKTILENGGGLGSSTHGPNNSNSNGVLTASRVGSSNNHNSCNSNKRSLDFVVVKPASVSTDSSYERITPQAIANYSEVPESKRRCIRMKPPIPSRYQG